MSANKIKICTKTVMDSTDPNIVFDKDGISDYYHNFINNILPNWDNENGNLDELRRYSEKIKNSSKGNDFDCIIGVSGGLDSSYTAYVAKEIMGLRPLIYHVDAGWNSDQAVSNIEKLLSGLNLELYTDVINWEEMKDVQLAFLKSQIPDQDLPQDYAFFSSLYRFANKNNIKYVLTGSNFSTECCREPEEWGGYAGIDKRLFNDIHSKFGTRKLKTFPIIDIFQYRLYYQVFKGMMVFKPLNLVRFKKSEAEKLLTEKYGWSPFKHKHHESRFTRFYEDYWLRYKFGFDKRKAHFSSLILTKQMLREEALERLKSPEMSPDFIRHEKEYVAKKLGISLIELDEIFNGKNQTFRNYKNKNNLIKIGAKATRIFGSEKRLFR